MPIRVVRYLQLLYAAPFVALVFLCPGIVRAFTIPDDLTLQTDAFVQIMDHTEVLSWYTDKTHLTYEPGKSPEFEDTTRACDPLPSFCDAFLSRATRSHIVLAHSLELLPDRLRMSIESFADKADRDPKDARLTVQDASVAIAVPAENGITVDIEASLAQLESALRSAQQATLTIRLPSIVTSAKVSAETLSSLGITELIGTATTNFRGSPKNRIYNITRAIQDFDGVIIEPGATFSFVDHLGEVDGEHGYLPELVIKNNKTEPEFGGGICQVSTTVFRAALQSGLKITERRNHAYPVQYYKPYGMDATVYVPRPDLKFTNNTPGTILLVPEINGTLLTFSMYGTRDGRTVTIDGPHILESHPDGSMKTVFTHTVKDASGNTLIDDMFWSNYKSPSLFPHPGDEPNYTTKPKGWSEKQWRDYKKIHP
ncbi:MAG: VanW family protein [Candidatus Moraniibacteriota bacterium]|nr:MAG: VanW family protein [Candidatus Moranbacteria bacterium]